MKELFISPISGVLVLALFAYVLVRRGLREVTGGPEYGSARLLAGLTLLFALEVVGRFLWLYG